MVNTEIVQMADRFSRRVQQAVTTVHESAKAEPLGPSGSMVLLALDDMKAAPLYRLVERVGRDKSQITRVVKSLVEQGLIDRTQCRDDRRVLRLTLTDVGQAKVREIRQTIDRVIDEVLVSLSKDEQDALRTLLQKVRL